MDVLKFIFMSAINSLPILTINNFKGTPPPDAFQSAYTVGQYDYVIMGTGPNIKIEVECWMRQDLSWINWKLPQLKDTNVLNHLLIHEQGHFNIIILFAKRLKRETRKIDVSNPKVEVPRLTKIKEDLAAQGSAMNEKYEIETRNGRNKDEQFKWDKIINAELVKLDNENVKVYFK